MVACIVGGVVLLFIAYKVYVKYYYHKQKMQTILPPTREPLAYSTHSMSPSTNTMMAGSLYGDAYNRDSWRASQSKASLSSHLDRGYGSEVNYPYHSQRRSSSQGLLASPPAGVYHHDSSAPNSPLSPSTDINGPSVPPSALDVYDSPQHSKALSSSSSTMTLKRSYASSVKSAGGMLNAPLPSHRRDSYLPHLPENRDQVQIVPPQPLGFGLGGMATSLDQKTLAFSTSSGIGGGDDDFTRGLVWQEGNPDAVARASKLGEEERMRYLAQGPVRTTSPAAMRGAVHNHLYAGSNAGSSGVRTPDVPSSRSRSPAHPAAWDGSSSSDVGPSVSQRGGVPPSHPLEPSNSTQSNISQNARNAALMNQQSPLALMSGGVSDGDPSHPLMAPYPPQKDSTSNSPILSAFRNPAQQQSHPATNPSSNEFFSHSHSNSANSGSANSGFNHGERTPGLMSENGSGSVPSAPMTDSSGRQSATEQRLGVANPGEEGSQQRQQSAPAGEVSQPQDAFLVDEERRIALGKDSQLQVVGDAPASPKQSEKRQSRGWGFSKMLGGRG